MSDEGRWTLRSSLRARTTGRTVTPNGIQCSNDLVDLAAMMIMFARRKSLNMQYTSVLAAAMVFVALALPPCLAQPGDLAAADEAIVCFANGVQLPGTLADGEGASGLGWRNSSFIGQFSFEIGALGVERLPHSPGQFADNSHYRLELSD